MSNDSPIVDKERTWGFFKDPLLKQTDNYSSEQNQLRIVTVLLTWHYHLKDYIFKLVLVASAV